MRRRADDDGVDLLLVDTGDRVEGNGLYDASTPKGEYTYDIFHQQNIDIICSGNHELYQADTADREHRITVPNFAGRYIASNLDYIEPATGEQVPMAKDRYRAFQTPNQKINIVAFGFLFNFTGNAHNSRVQPVQQTVQEDWFQYAITEEPVDLFVVIGHVGARMGELRAIYEAIRAKNPATPIAIFAGHAHVRDAVQFDDNALALASGRYFETIGWMSVDGLAIKETKEAKEVKEARTAVAPTVSFSRRYIDTNLLGLYYHSGTNATTFSTEQGANLTDFIAAGRSSLGLETVFGCAPQNYWLQRRSVEDPDSLFSLLKKRILPEAIVSKDRADKPRVVIMNTGSMRFDVYRGAFTRDSTYIVSPFISLVNYIPDVPYALARQVNYFLNNNGPILSSLAAEVAAKGMDDYTRGVDWREMGVPEQYAMKEEGEHSAGAKGRTKGGSGASPQKPLFGRGSTHGSGSGSDAETGRPPLVAGYTTHDDLGDDGDDAVHEPLPYFSLPNCIEADVGFPAEEEPETVDLIFFDFIQRFVLMALAVAGGSDPDAKHYSESDIQTYLEGKFTDYLLDWIETNWKDECQKQV